MNKLLALLTLTAGLVSFPAKTLADGSHQNKLKLAAQYLQPALSDEDAEVISEEITQASEDLGVRWEVILAILFQESSLKLDPQGCLHKKGRCKDYGIGQVNFNTWGTKFGWDRVRLLRDLRYSLKASFQVLGHYKKEYGKQEFNWFTRYHSGTPSFRGNYMQALNRRYARINTFLDGFERGRSYASSEIEETGVEP